MWRRQSEEEKVKYEVRVRRDEGRREWMKRGSGMKDREERSREMEPLITEFLGKIKQRSLTMNVQEKQSNKGFR